MKKIDRTKEIFGLSKIPPEALLKLSRVENGKLKAYIDELEDKIKKLMRITKPYTEEDSEKLDIVMGLYHRLSLADLKLIQEGIVRRENAIQNAAEREAAEQEMFEQEDELTKYPIQPEVHAEPEGCVTYDQPEEETQQQTITIRSRL